MALLHMVVGAISIALALGQPGQAEATGAIEQLAANPWGPAVMWACMIGCAGLALWQLSEATLRARRKPRKERVAKGIALNLAGLLFVIAAAKQSPEESSGLDGSLKALRDHPYGPYLLLAIGAGFICYGIFALVRSKFGRM